jgi:hypothetical protein
MDTQQTQHQQMLSNVLAGLEATKATLEYQIALVRQLIQQSHQPVQTVAQVSGCDDEDILGIDSIGRVIKRRHLSPEVLAKKRQLMASVRQKRLQELNELREFKAQHNEGTA